LGELKALRLLILGGYSGGNDLESLPESILDLPNLEYISINNKAISSAAKKLIETLEQKGIKVSKKIY
jgi:Leucine-rich repeat (LRR) protein